MFNHMCTWFFVCHFLLFCVCICVSHLRGVDSSLLEGAVAGVLRAHVTIFAPVTGEVSINTGQAPGVSEKGEKM